MLDIGWSELVVIGVVALVVVGPKELPTLLRTAGQWVGKARRMAAEFQGQLNEAIREAELEDVKKSVEDLRSLSPTRLIGDQLTSIGDEVKSVGTSATAALASVETAAAEPAWHADAAGAGSAMSGFTVADAPAMPDVEAEKLIDAAAPQVEDPAPPVFDLTPAPPLAVTPEPAIDAATAEAEKKVPGA